MSDKLAKQLHQHLINAAESCAEKGWPYSAGWQDFICGDRPETTDPVEMAIEAVWYLADCDGGQWTKPQLCLQAAMAFLKQKTGISVKLAHGQKLRLIVSAPPNRQSLTAWFRDAYTGSRT